MNLPQRRNIVRRILRIVGCRRKEAGPAKFTDKELIHILGWTEAKGDSNDNEPREGTGALTHPSRPQDDQGR